MMTKEQMRRFIAARAARELKDGDVVNLGIGLPTLVPLFIPENVHVTLQAEDGIARSAIATEENSDPMHIIDAGGTPAVAALGGSYFDSATSFGLIRGGHVDATILGGLEVDEEGNLANWIIPGKKMPGMGGAMDLMVGAKHVILAMEHTVNGKPKILRRCTLPLTAVKCVHEIITEMCVFQVTPDGLLMTEINSEFTVDQVRAATEAHFHVALNLKSMLA